MTVPLLHHCYGFSRPEYQQSDEKTVKPLIPKIDLLNEIRERFDATFTLEVVPSICFEHEKPCISPSMKVIDFCSKARADLDIDWYMDNT